jgi:ribosomal protein L13E
VAADVLLRQEPDEEDEEEDEDESLHPQSRFRDVAQISRGKFDRLRRTTAGFTTSELDGYGLRNQ